jgi:hypothetical protein
LIRDAGEDVALALVEKMKEQIIAGGFLSARPLH